MIATILTHLIAASIGACLCVLAMCLVAVGAAARDEPEEE